MHDQRCPDWADQKKFDALPVIPYCGLKVPEAWESEKCTGCFNCMHADYEFAEKNERPKCTYWEWDSYHRLDREVIADNNNL